MFIKVVNLFIVFLSVVKLRILLFLSLSHSLIYKCKNCVNFISLRLIRNKFGLRPGEYIDKRTGEIKSRSFRSQALKKAAKSTEYGLRRFGGRRFRFR